MQAVGSAVVGVICTLGRENACGMGAVVEATMMGSLLAGQASGDSVDACAK